VAFGAHIPTPLSDWVNKTHVGVGGDLGVVGVVGVGVGWSCCCCCCWLSVGHMSTLIQHSLADKPTEKNGPPLSTNHRRTGPPIHPTKQPTKRARGAYTQTRTNETQSNSHQPTDNKKQTNILTQNINTQTAGTSREQQGPTWNTRSNREQQ